MPAVSLSSSPFFSLLIYIFWRGLHLRRIASAPQFSAFSEVWLLALSYALAGENGSSYEKSKKVAFFAKATTNGQLYYWKTRYG
jgi:hypothetical protein